MIGIPAPKVSWYFDENLVSQGTEGFRILQNGTLIIENPTIDDAGIYKCAATNYLGKETATADVRVNGELYPGLF